MKTLSEYLAANPKKVLILDFDNTIFHLDLPWDVYNRGVLKVVANLDPEWAVANLDSTNFVNNVLDIIIAKHGPKVRDQINAYAQKFEHENLRNYQENPELITFIEENYQNYDLYLWTSNMLATVEPILSRYDLDSCFKKLITRDSVNLIKPYPDGFEIIHKAQPLEKSEYLMIGDSKADKDAASTAGIDFFPITYFK